MGTAEVAVLVGLLVAGYEAVAVNFRKTPTITELTYKAPWLVRLGLLLGAGAWALDHFKVWDWI